MSSKVDVCCCLDKLKQRMPPFCPKVLGHQTADGEIGQRECQRAYRFVVMGYFPKYMEG